MFRSFSLPKSATALSFLVAGALGSLLAVEVSPTAALRHEPSLMQSFEPFANNQWSAQTTADNSRTGVALALLAGGGAVIVASALQHQRQPQSTRDRYSVQSRRQGDDVNVDRASGKLKKRLMRLLHDDRATANRLLTQVSFKYPNHPTDWYMEKVIYDLERDRGSK
ncbi:hypothetical protein IQ268_14370 [Oculatella sp. LEGE 06141]|uniref:hypothetical protein n=1 Tax=Oculatella sp. LEGE 06141 TaxID=1828648 RepID=UPI001880DC07|nr:hypothetical protein [Oculatella sp. LEGE 06141]MBE9179751.1 hypothetical protein [Oculatella sp. LEGE 06141]